VFLKNAFYFRCPTHLKQLFTYTLLGLLLSCSDEEGTDINQLKGILHTLQNQRDSLIKTQRASQDKIFELELAQPAAQLATDTFYLRQQESLRQIQFELKSLDKEIEDKQAQIYMPK